MGADFREGPGGDTARQGASDGEAGWSWGRGSGGSCISGGEPSTGPTRSAPQTAGELPPHGTCRQYVGTGLRPGGRQTLTGLGA